MAQIGLELAGRIFLAGRADRHALQGGGVVQRGQERLIAVEIVKSVHGAVWSRARPVRGERGGSGRPRVVALLVDQIEFELMRRRPA